MFSIRKAVYADAETISEIHVQTWKNTYTDLLEEQDLTNMTFENRKTLWETVLSMKNKKQCTLVIENVDNIVGFISGGPERTDRFDYDSEIYTIYIIDEYQKKGLGAQLLKAFSEEMKALGYRSILVWVLTQNPSSRFYERYLAKTVGNTATTIGEGSYQETAYGWDDIDALLALL